MKNESWKNKIFRQRKDEKSSTNARTNVTVAFLWEYSQAEVNLCFLLLNFSLVEPFVGTFHSFIKKMQLSMENMICSLFG